MLKAILVNYNFDPQDWWLEYGLQPENVTLFDRSDDGVARTFAAKTYKTENIGNVDYDKLGFLIENYYDLPETFLWSKSNIFKYVAPETLQAAIAKNVFAPLLKYDHATYADKSLPDGGWNPVCLYDTDGMYYERYGIVNTLHQTIAWRHFKQWEEWCAHFNIPQAAMIPFPPGGSFILTKERVQRYGVDFYREMRDTLGYAQIPLEAYFCERSYYLLWK